MSTEATFAKSAASMQVGHRWWLFAACVLISLTNEVSNAVTNLSLSPMRNDLGASSAVMQIAVTLGKLMLGAFMLAGGVAGDTMAGVAYWCSVHSAWWAHPCLQRLRRRAECSWQRAP
jgi:hypothetical protein